MLRWNPHGGLYREVNATYYYRGSTGRQYVLYSESVFIGLITMAGVPKYSRTASALIIEVTVGAITMLLSPSSWMNTWHCNRTQRQTHMKKNS